MNLISEKNRINKLLEFGIPKIFIESIGNTDQLSFLVEDVDGAYFYLPKISNYEILKDYNIIPIFNCGNTFYALIYSDYIKKIITFELENDQIYIDYGMNWNLLLMDIMIDYFDFNIEDGLDNKEFCLVGNKIGFTQSNELFHLRNLSIEDYNLKFEDTKKWRIEIAQQLDIL